MERRYIVRFYAASGWCIIDKQTGQLVDSGYKTEALADDMADAMHSSPDFAQWISGIHMRDKLTSMLAKNTEKEESKQ